MFGGFCIVACAAYLAALLLTGPRACGAQYWDSAGLGLPPAPPPGAPAPLAEGLLRALAERPYDGGAEDARWRRRAPEEELPREIEAEAKGAGTTPGGRGARMALVGKCCPIGQNLSDSHGCAPSALPFQPIFFNYNRTGIWDYDVNEWETIAGNPCQYGKYRLDPGLHSEDEFYLLRNGSLLAPFQSPPMLGPRDFCMETFWAGGEALALPLVCFPEPPPAPPLPYSVWLIFIAIIMLVSVPFLVATCLTHALVREVWQATGRRHARALAAHSGCLAVAFFSLAVTQLSASHTSKVLCVIAAHTIQFSFLACFFWLNLLCLDTYLNITRRLSPLEAERKARAGCSLPAMPSPWGWRLWGWGTPTVITLTTLLLDQAPGLPLSVYRPNFGADVCWFQTDVSTLVYFYGPVSLLLIANMVLFGLTMRSLSRQSLALRPLEAAAMGLQLDTELPEGPPGLGQRLLKYKRVFKMCVVLFLVMGVSWSLEVLSWFVGGNSPLWFFSDLFNALQGIIIFGIFMRQPILSTVWSKIKEKYPWLAWRRTVTDTEVVSEMTSIGCNGIGNGAQPAPV